MQLKTTLQAERKRCQEALHESELGRNQLDAIKSEFTSKERALANDFKAREDELRADIKVRRLSPVFSCGGRWHSLASGVVRIC